MRRACCRNRETETFLSMSRLLSPHGCLIDSSAGKAWRLGYFFGTTRGRSEDGCSIVRIYQEGAPNIFLVCKFLQIITRDYCLLMGIISISKNDLLTKTNMLDFSIFQ